jgi:hypothetical protein
MMESGEPKWNVVKQLQPDAEETSLQLEARATLTL